MIRLLIRSYSQIMKSTLIKASILGVGLFASTTQALNLQSHPRLQKSVQPLIDNGEYSQQELNAIFKQVSLRETVIKKKANAAEKKLTWGGGRRPGGYKGIFIQKDRIKKGSIFWKENTQTMSKAFDKYEVQPEIISAIIGVETKFGANKGKHKVIESIATFANKGSKLQFGQLPIFLSLVKKGHLDLNVKGSYSGAMGVPQFISSSYRDFGVDFDADGKVDLLNNNVDAIGSVANYFAKHHWRQDERVMYKVNPASKEAASLLDQQSVTRINSRSKPKTTLLKVSSLLKEVPSGLLMNTPVGIFKFINENGDAEYFLGLHNFYVIMRYNHSYLYARAVYELSQEILKEHNLQGKG